MTRNSQSSYQQGFTLVELLIVVIILGILAAVVIPQFNNASSEAKESAAASNLATLRQAIEMYKVQHDDNFPGATVVTQLTTGTNQAGAAGSQYGPYIRNGFPKSPATSANTVKIVTTMPGSASGTEGWVYNTTDGEIRLNAAGAAQSGTNWYDL